mmetsp:Transcript_27544/g.38279  ORF Transcript_27544/g.38279 Transcript_27544/m.38279 type:complete len:439 (-) Transcript_27544:78-1394(-)
MSGKSPGNRAWGVIAPKKPVSFSSVMSEQLASNIEAGHEGRDPRESYANTARPHILAELKLMGFSSSRIEVAALATGNMRTDAALEWLLSHPVDDAVAANDDIRANGAEEGRRRKEIMSEETSQQEQDRKDREVALQLAAMDNSELSLEEARQLHRPYSKITVSRDPKLARLYSDQQNAMRKSLRETEENWFSQENGKNRVSKKASLAEQLEEMVTKHDSEQCAERNAERLMNLDFADDYNQAGDMSSLRLSNRTYNSFKRQIDRIKTRTERKNMGGRRTRATFARAISGDAAAAIAQREDEVGPNLGPGAPCMAFASADRQWHSATVTGLATSLPRRYKVRFDDTSIEEFLPVAHIREMPETGDEQSSINFCSGTTATHGVSANVDGDNDFVQTTEIEAAGVGGDNDFVQSTTEYTETKEAGFARESQTRNGSDSQQ